MCDALLGLPGDVLCGVLSNWLALMETVRLDTALCNRRWRTIFLGSLRSVEIVEQHKHNFPICACYGWMIKKSIPIRSISVHNVSVHGPGCLLRQPRTIAEKFMKRIGWREVFMAKWLCRTLPGCSKDLHALSIKTTDSDNAFTPTMLAAISTCTNLRSLCLMFRYTRSTRTPLNISLTSILRQCQVLQKLGLGECTFTEQDALMVAPCLEQFTFASGSKSPLTPQTLVNLVTRCPTLQQLHINELWWLHGDRDPPPLFDAPMFQLMANSLHNLRCFSVQTAAVVDFVGLQVLLHSCKSLRYISLGGCITLDADTFTTLVLTSNLTHLELYQNNHLTGALSTILCELCDTKARTTMLRLKLEQFSGLTQIGLSSLRAVYPDLLVLSIHGHGRLSWRR